VETGLHALGIPLDDIRVTVEGDLDLQGTLGMSKTVPVGFEGIRVNFHVRAPQATQESGCRGYTCLRGYADRDEYDAVPNRNVSVTKRNKSQ